MLLQPHTLLWTAIKKTRMIRVCLSWQGSRCGTARPRNPQWFRPVAELASCRPQQSPSSQLAFDEGKVDEMTDLVLLDQTFPGGRPTASGKHIQWDVLFIRVQPASDYLRAGSQ
jgi:hypothetical protein